MNGIEVGRFAESMAGHDLGKVFVIFSIGAEYVYLVDGKIRTIAKPKKKKIKHIRVIGHLDHVLADKIISKTVNDEAIKRAIKLFNKAEHNKEVE